MTDASAGWKAEYAHAAVSPSIDAPTCDVRHCTETFGLQAMQTSAGVMQVCRRHAKHLIGVSS